MPSLKNLRLALQSGCLMLEVILPEWQLIVFRIVPGRLSEEQHPPRPLAAHPGDHHYAHQAPLAPQPLRHSPLEHLDR